MKSINYKGDIGHKRIKIPSTERGYKEMLSFLNSTNKVIDDNISDSSNICNDYLNV